MPVVAHLWPCSRSSPVSIGFLDRLLQLVPEVVEASALFLFFAKLFFVVEEDFLIGVGDPLLNCHVIGVMLMKCHQRSRHLKRRQWREDGIHLIPFPRQLVLIQCFRTHMLSMHSHGCWSYQVPGLDIYRFSMSLFHSHL